MPIPLRLLLVEDSEDDAVLLERVLQLAGYELQACRRVESAGAMRAALEDCAWDLIISDHVMPEFNAPAALGLAKELCPGVPLVIVSGEIDLNLAVSLIKDGALDFIQKSELARLPAAVERVLRSQAERREQKRASRELEERIRFETLLSDLSTSFFQEPGDDIHALVERSLRRVIEFLGMDRGSLHELSADGSAFQVTFSYAIPGAVPALPALSADQFPWYVGQLKNNRPVLFDRVEDAPPEASVEVEFCRRGGVQMVMAVPLCSGEIVSGALTFIAFHPVAPHNETITQRMRLIGELLLNAVRRSRAEAERRQVEIVLRESALSLRESEARFRAIIEQNSEGVVLVDEEGRIIEWNQAQERISGIAREDILGHYIWDVQARFALPERRTPERLAKHRQAMLDALHTGQSYIFDRPVEAVTQRADGTRVYIQQTVFPIRVGERFRIGLVTRDNSERKRAEAEIQELNAALEQRVRERTVQLEAALKELEAFSYSVSHDLRAPLRHLDGYARILQEDYSDALDKQGLHYLARIQQSAQHMSELVEGLLNLSRLSRGDLTREPVYLSRLAEEVAAGLRQREPERAVDLTIQPGLVVQADGTLMRVVLENLLGNAWKFTARTAQARIEFGCQEKDSPVFFVRDNGAGFDMTAAARLFSPFQRLHNAQDFPGTGIGLATVRRIITRHGGRVWAESLPGEGAVFFFTL